jgi:hypothetical protein
MFHRTSSAEVIAGTVISLLKHTNLPACDAVTGQASPGTFTFTAVLLQLLCVTNALKSSKTSGTARPKISHHNLKVYNLFTL